MTAPATSPPTSAATASLIRPAAAWAAIPAIGKLRKPAVHSSQPLTLKRRSYMGCPGAGLAATPVRLRVALVGSVVMVCSRGLCSRESVKGGPV